MRTLLFLAPLPAIGGSVAVMQLTAAGPALVRQQLAVTAVAVALGAAGALAARRAAPWSLHGLLAAVPLLLAAPLWSTDVAGPERWVRLGGTGLYVASIVLPAAVLLLATALRAVPRRPVWPLAATAATAADLAVQPDAPQATAFAVAVATALWRAGVPRARSAGTCATLSVAVAAAWWQPDPLVPVAHVEGTLQVARAAGPLALLGAVVALALPPAALAWCGRAETHEPLVAVAAYYVTIDVLAATQWTPMPLLGFGAGPILGYALMAALAARLAAASPDGRP